MDTYKVIEKLKAALKGWFPSISVSVYGKCYSCEKDLTEEEYLCGVSRLPEGAKGVHHCYCDGCGIEFLKEIFKETEEKSGGE